MRWIELKGFNGARRLTVKPVCVSSKRKDQHGGQNTLISLLHAEHRYPSATPPSPMCSSDSTYSTVHSLSCRPWIWEKRSPFSQMSPDVSSQHIGLADQILAIMLLAQDLQFLLHSSFELLTGTWVQFLHFLMNVFGPVHAASSRRW